jgi:hypothetical protein
MGDSSIRPAGLLMYHNTIIGEQAVRSPNGNVHWRNSLFLGRDTPERGIMTWANATGTFRSDYNGFRPNKGVAAQYSWLAPKEPSQTLYYNKPEDWQRNGPSAARCRRGWKTGSPQRALVAVSRRAFGINSFQNGVASKLNA